MRVHLATAARGDARVLGARPLALWPQALLKRPKSILYTIEAHRKRARNTRPCALAQRGGDGDARAPGRAHADVRPGRAVRCLCPGSVDNTGEDELGEKGQRSTPALTMTRVISQILKST